MAIDPVSGQPFESAIFYPATGQPGTMTIGPRTIGAVKDAEPLPGRHPLVILSHGSGGNRLGHHDMAAYLAQAGFIVACPEHPLDNSRDQSGVGTDKVLIGRPAQCKALLNTLLADPVWSPLIDSGRIGAAGFSAGGYTSLLLAGAKPDFSLFDGYCARHQEDHLFCTGRGNTARDLNRYGPVVDDRIKAVFAMAPLSIVFDAEGLKGVTVPVFLYGGAKDPVLLPDENFKRIAPLLPNLTELKLIPDAEHMVFLAPCPEETASRFPKFCVDPPGVDRFALHEQINKDALDFFRRELHVQ